jgi:hypothetical protein
MQLVVVCVVTVVVCSGTVEGAVTVFAVVSHSSMQEMRSAQMSAVIMNRVMIFLIIICLRECYLEARDIYKDRGYKHVFARVFFQESWW